MLITTSILIEQLSNYSDPYGRIRRLTCYGELTSLIKGLYETDPDTPGHVLAQAIYGPSYLSFNYALSKYGLIPEAVYTYTSATCLKNKKKEYTNAFGTFTYRDIPVDAFSLEVRLEEEGDRAYWIAGAEKALCDKLYTLPPSRNIRELRELLFDDLRIDEEDFRNLNHEVIKALAPNYHCKNLDLLTKL